MAGRKLVLSSPVWALWSRTSRRASAMAAGDPCPSRGREFWSWTTCGDDLSCFVAYLQLELFPVHSLQGHYHISKSASQRYPHKPPQQGYHEISRHGVCARTPGQYYKSVAEVRSRKSLFQKDNLSCQYSPCA
jgi:hypothetical protein